MCKTLNELKKRMIDKKKEMRDRLDELRKKSLLERENEARLFIIDLYAAIERYIVSCLEVYGSIVNDKIKNTELSLDDIKEDILGSTFKVHEKSLMLKRKEAGDDEKKNLYTDTRERYHKIMNGQEPCFCLDREALRKTWRSALAKRMQSVLVNEYKLEMPRSYKYEENGKMFYFSDVKDRIDWIKDLSEVRNPLAHGSSLTAWQKQNDSLETSLESTNRVLAIYYTAMENGMNAKPAVYLK